jgi:hypothetical protein
MAGLRGKSAWIAAGKQTAKGTAATAPKHMYPFAGGNVQPRREVERLQETDDKRDMGVTYVRSSGVEGSAEVYVRDASVDFLIAAALGAVVDSGTMPNYSHAITPASALPYLTVWRMIGDTLYEKFTDVMVSELSIRAEAGSPLVASVGLVGLTPERLTSDPTGAWAGVTLESGTVYTYNDATVTLAGGATSLVSSFEMTISNNVETQQTDSVTPYDLVPGTLEVTLGFDMIFESLNEYNRFHYGTTSGTTVSNSLATVAANFKFDKGANNEVTFDFPGIAYEEFPVEPQADGGAVTVSVRAAAQRQSGGTAMVTATVKNQKATTF